jgi:hypothetical protein
VRRFGFLRQRGSWNSTTWRQAATLLSALLGAGLAGCSSVPPAVTTGPSVVQPGINLAASRTLAPVSAPLTPQSFAEPEAQLADVVNVRGIEVGTGLARAGDKIRILGSGTDDVTGAVASDGNGHLEAASTRLIATQN